MAEDSVASILLELARQDAKAKSMDDPEIGDALLGFHARQAVEKALKAMLSNAGIVHRRTRDIAELLDLLTDSGLPAPPHADVLDELNPFAVEMHYGLLQPTGLDRVTTLARMDGVIEWAGRRLGAK